MKAFMLRNLGLLGLVGVCGAQTPVPDNPDWPPSSIWSPNPVGLYRVSDLPKITATVTMSVDTQKVDIGYRHRHVSGNLVSATQSFSVPFWPTDACYSGPTTLCVFGKAVNTGKTVIQTWVFAPCSLEQDGNDDWVIVPGDRTAVTTVYENLEAGKKLVRAAHALHGAADPSVLLLFNDSRDLYVLNLRTAVFSLVASGQGSGSGYLLVPDLTKPWQQLVSNRLAAGGYVYFFREGHDLASNDLEILTFIDSDEDGSLDSSSLVVGDDWLTLQYHKATTWDQSHQ